MNLRSTDEQLAIRPSAERWPIWATVGHTAAARAYWLSGVRPPTSTQWGMLRLTSVGRRTGKARVAILGYLVDGPNLVIPAMNGWADPEPA